MDITMSREQYEALLKHVVQPHTPEAIVRFSRLRKSVDERNSIRRYPLCVRYMPTPNEVINNSGIVAGAKSRFAEYERPPTRDDVDALLQGESYDPSSVHVTVDPLGQLGWYEVDKFPWDGRLW